MIAEFQLGIHHRNAHQVPLRFESEALAEMSYEPQWAGI